MNIREIFIELYEIPLTTGIIRSGALLTVVDEEGNTGRGEVAPLPKWSKESLADALTQFEQKRQEIVDTLWSFETCFETLAKLNLYPSLSFGLESALLSIFSPLENHTIPLSALFMGSPAEILKRAQLRHKEGYTSAKLKVNNLSFDEAFYVINELKHQFHLRIDVNRAWKTSDALHFFSQFPKEIFDYVEEPFQNPKDLSLFTHPLAVDESFPDDFSLTELESLPMLKALIYKPTIQGGMLHALPLRLWTKKRGISLVLSSSFESNVGSAHVAAIAYRLGLDVPVGTGTSHYLSSNCTARCQR